MNKYIRKSIKLSPLLLGFVVITGCVDSGEYVSDANTNQEDTYFDIYELEIDNEIGPIDDGSSETEYVGSFEGDFEEDIDGNVLEIPELGAARPPSLIHKQEGAWSRVFNWPVSPIHLALLPDGSVLSYGTNPDAQNATAFTFDRWFRYRGKDPSSHETTPTGIKTNLFCSAQTLMSDGNMLISGGDMNAVDDQSYKNNAVNATTLYDYSTNVLSNGSAMVYPRWYPTLVTLPNGKQLVLGGRSFKNGSGLGEDGQPNIPPTPEVYNPETGKWSLLSGATNQTFFNRSWYYPRAFVRDDGNIVVADLGQDTLYELSVEDEGSLTNIASFPGGSFGGPNRPVAMFDTGKILFVNSQSASVLDIRSGGASLEAVSAPNISRGWANATVLANGEVYLSGGISKNASDNSGDYPGEIWNPDTDEWTMTAMAQKARLYHSTAILLPNAKVLVAGGGPPGPVINMNAELFLPPYLFDDEGAIASRPRIRNVGDVDYNKNFNMVVRNEPISKVAFIRAGSATHSFDQGQRYMELKFTQSDAVLEVSAPQNANLAPPGLYMIFIFNATGVPSHAKLVMLGEGNNMMSFSDFQGYSTFDRSSDAVATQAGIAID